ncbi:MAG: carboxy-S-adenosyl-L-methionine synthase CmoA [Pseudomonadales bacterium]|nr:carboxy-S-adenosyl-L-methionine synthase CmoA [Pseudomonadales bacterium]
MTNRDSIFRDPQQIVDFAFDQRVVDVFPDMIRRSIPGYDTIISISGLMLAEHLKDSEICYDLGCSLGATTLAIAQRLGKKRCKLIAIDNSEAMLTKARKLLTHEAIELMMSDIRQVDLQPAGAVVMNFTLQFIAPKERLALIKKIYAALRPGGLLIISEKIHCSETAEEDYFNAIHAQYKMANGYTGLEVSQKRSALEKVMIIDDIETHQQRMNEAGFSDIKIWFRCLNWASILAVK